MELVKFKTFYTVAKLGSFTKAAESLYVTQPAISLQVKELENEYNVQLFERIGKKVRLTSAGNALMPFAEQMLNAYMNSHTAVEEAGDSTSENIRIGATNYTGIHFLPELISGFLSLYPDSNVGITLQYARKIQLMLLSNEIDLGIIGENQYRISEVSLLEQELYHDRIMVVTSARHRWNSRTSVTAEELAGEKIILPVKTALTRQFIERYAAMKGISFKAAYEIENTYMIKRMVEQDLGVTLMCSGEVRKECESGWLRAFPMEDLQIDRRVIMVYHRDKPLSLALNRMIDFLIESRGSYQKKLIGNIRNNGSPF